MKLQSKVLYNWGCRLDLQTPSLTVVAEAGEKERFSGSHLGRLHRLICSEVGVSTRPNFDVKQIHDVKGTLKILASWMMMTSEALKLPLSQKSMLYGLSGDLNKYVLTLPNMHFVGPKQVSLLRYLVEACHEETFKPKKFKKGLREGVEALSKSIPGANTRFILRAARRKDVPILHLANATFQLGLGCQSRLLESSMTDDAASIMVRLVRVKSTMAEVLKAAAIPCIEGVVVKNKNNALKVAKTLGYPVVVKPNDLDGGVAVYCNISTPEELSEKTEEVLNHSKSVLIQRHIPGRDFRIMVIKGKAIAVIERVPGQVTGDGHASVKELIEAYNDHPMRGSQAHLPLKPLTIDEEAKSFMRRAGMTKNSVLPEGEVLQLRSAANIARGGLPVNVTSTCHPDNLDLAERAAKIFRLDVAGIDLLIPDITKSWKTSRAAICEVNAAPVIGYFVTRHIYPILIDALMEGQQGHIPTIMFLANERNSPMFNRLVSSLSQLFKGLATIGESLTLGQQKLCKSQGHLMTDLSIVLKNTDVDCVLCEVIDKKKFRSGLPIEKIDYLLVSSDLLEKQSSIDEETIVQLAKMVRHLSVFQDSEEQTWNIPDKIKNAIVSKEEQPEEQLLSSILEIYPSKKNTSRVEAE